jgi:hypothetical protein
MKPHAAVETRFIATKACVTKKIDFLGEMYFGCDKIHHPGPPQCFVSFRKFSRSPKKHLETISRNIKQADNCYE